ncbi:hypothetical protein FOL47_005353 [Perkinsus chesapeaki]|uniref:Uncharacterized protein n=1 Tax=Perkinsus chesapeaki TaxID=330153 RepID=A0A7J6N2K6_PERCH|nr:hypothetical protein FOL47_005353 [Perkinsus chesapeaki]
MTNSASILVAMSMYVAQAIRVRGIRSASYFSYTPDLVNLSSIMIDGSTKKAILVFDDRQEEFHATFELTGNGLIFSFTKKDLRVLIHYHPEFYAINEHLIFNYDYKTRFVTYTLRSGRSALWLSTLVPFQGEPAAATEGLMMKIYS